MQTQIAFSFMLAENEGSTVKKSLTVEETRHEKASVDLSTLTEDQADFYKERLAIMAYEQQQEHGRVNEAVLSGIVYGMARGRCTTPCQVIGVV